MVPDEWVTQTGSDFDVDSIYGICYEMYMDKEGILRKIEMDTDESTEAIERRYCNYINSLLEHRIKHQDISDNFIKNETKDLFDKLQDENARLKDPNNKAFRAARKEYLNAEEKLSKKDKIKLLDIKAKYTNAYDRYNAIAKYFMELTDTAKDDETRNIYIDIMDAAIDMAELIGFTKERINENYKQFREAKNEKVKELYQTARKEYVDSVKAAAKKLNLVSFEEFSEWNIIDQQSRRARNNEILKSMVAIMEHPSSREENYSRSNFDDITNSLNKMKDLLGISKIERSAYNPLDQIDFFENAISGRKLKAFSVTRDTFNSICNHTKARLSLDNRITVVYDLNDSKFSKENLIAAFGDDVRIDETNNTAIVTHSRIGNSLNNRNAVGKLLTPYSSQTTAHILDAIKEGAIPNENEYTFGTFKTLVDVGVDYDTAIGFLMQPAISRIVEASNENNSIYISGGNNPIHVAIKRIAADLGIMINGKPVNDFTSINSVWYNLNNNEELKNAFIKVFGADFNKEQRINTQQYKINGKLQENRLKSENRHKNSAKYSYEEAAFDIATILTFDKVHETTKNIEAIARLLKPDSFGAKQTIHSTRKVKDTIIHFLSKESNKANTILSGKTNLLDAVYPNILNGDIDVENSAYPYLAAFFKYSTNYSIDINSQLFLTESDNFVALSDTIENKLGRNLTDEQYKELIKYIVQDIYNSVPLLTTPVTVDKNGYIIYDTERIKKIIEREKIDVSPETLSNYYDLVDEFNNSYWEFEKYRIFGYDVLESTGLEINDINNPTTEDIAAFNDLTPAQKVIWIQQNFKDNAGIFNHIAVNTFHQNEYKTKGYSGQSIRFNDQINNIEELYIQFNKAFFYKNPLIRLAAIDLIKYAFIVEGFNFKKGSISKIITNKAINSDINDKGIQLVPAIKEAMNIRNNPLEKTNTKFIDKFIRSHSEFVKQINLPKNEYISKVFNQHITSDNIVFIEYSKENADLLEKLTISPEDFKDYIRISRYDNNTKILTLYKIAKTEKGVFLLPLNLLEKTETNDVSVNKQNNKYKQIDYYKNIVDYCTSNEISIKSFREQDGVIELINKWNDAFTIRGRKFTKVTDTVRNTKELMRLQDTGTTKQKAVINKFINDINKVLDDNKLPDVQKPLVFNPDLSLTAMFPKGVEVVQFLPTGEETKAVSITRIKPSKYLIRYVNAILNEQSIDAKTYNKIPDNEKVLIQDLIDTKSINPNIYKIEVLKDEEVEQQYIEDNTKAEEESKRMFATTHTIQLNTEEEFDYEDIDKVGVRMFRDINKHARLGEEKAVDFKQAMDMAGVDHNSGKSIQSNRKSIYESAADYYTRRSIELINDIENFECLDGTTFAINDPELYEHLRENPEDYFRLVKVILDAKTFGGAFSDIFNLNLEGEDPLTKRYIEDIKKAVNKIRDSKLLVGKNGALNLLFNDYIANEYSSNPNIRRGLIQLTSQFDDISWWDLNLADIADVGHKQIQAVVALVYNIIDTANTIVAPKAVSEFNKRVKEIEAISGELNYDKILPNGNFVKTYSEDFIKVKEEMFQKVNDAKEQFGEYSKEHFEAKLERDKWLTKYTHQPYVDEYYEEKNKLYENTYRIAGEDFLEYLRIKNELNKQRKDFALMSKEERDEYDVLVHKLNELQSDITGPIDNPQLKNDAERRKADAIKKFNGAMKKLNSTYFDTIEKSNFRKTLTYFIKIKKNYEESHPNETLDMRLQDPDYRRAYDWIAHNSYYKFSEDVQEQIDEAYKLLYPTSGGKKGTINSIIKSKGAYDIYGRINPKLLSEDDINNIKNAIIYDRTRHYGTDEDRVHLIKDVPTDIPVYTEDFYKKIRNEKEFNLETAKQILEVSKRINELIQKGFKPDGTLDTIKLFKALSKEELKELGESYKKLRELRKERKSSKAYKNTIKQMTDSGELKFMVNSKSYNANRLQKDTLTPEEQSLWYEIFTESDGANLVPNKDIFGYIKASTKYISNQLTSAKELIEDNIITVKTEYYYEAEQEARQLTDEEIKGLTEEEIEKLADEKYNKWFELNHIFNPKTKRMEPLSIWTEREANPNGSLKGSYSYVPTYDNTNRKIKEAFKNKLFHYGLDNYKIFDNNGVDVNPYANKDIPLLNDKELAMLNLLKEVMQKYIIENKEASYVMKKFAQEGHAPRRAKYEADTKFYLGQALGAVGLQTGHTGDADWIEHMDYTDDVDIPFPMMQTIRTKGYKEKIPITPRGVNESVDEYQKRISDIKKQNKEIEEYNSKLEQKVLDKDWPGVFSDFIAQVIDYNARYKAKDSIYLLMEDLKHRGAYKLSGYRGRVMKDRNVSVDEQTEYETKNQERALSLTENWMRRLVFKQFKKNQPFVKYADLMQNVTSAKYMIFNVTGGIANIGTGTANIIGEVFARNYFDLQTWGEAQGEYFGNALSILADMYSPTSKNEVAQILKQFNVVNFDSITERRNNESATEYTRRVQDALYSFQSGGEHYMQNTALLAMLRSHRVIKDKKTGKTEVKTFNEYSWDVEIQVLETLLAQEPELLERYQNFVKTQKADLNQIRKYDTFTEDFNENFLRSLNNKEFVKKYITERNKALDNAKVEFKEFPTFRSQLELVGDVVLPKDGSGITKEHFGRMRSKTVKVNDKIHGVYHKIGAAKIEAEWWGGLVMQYHKHIYPGIMKRWRIKGYYNEIRGSVERGSYMSIYKLLSTEFKHAIKEIKDSDDATAVESVKAIAKAAIDTIININLNYQLMPVWEQNNMKRALGDLLGVTSAFLLATGVHMITDEDELEDSNFYATLIYLADRLNAESQMYTPWGLWTEASTLWSSPIAAQNGPKDLIKGLSIGIQALYDEDFNINYTTGLYKGQNKLAVLLYRNTPIYRVYQRLSTMDRNNSYYRINETALNIKFAKTIADEINPD